MPARIMDDEIVWDRFVDNSPYGTLFHKWKFLKIMEKYSGSRLLPYGVFKGGELVSIFPLFYRAGKGLRHLSSPPRQSILYVPYLGHLFGPAFDQMKQHRKEALVEDIVQSIEAEIAPLAPNYVSVYMVPGLIDTRAFIWSGYTAELGYTYMMNLERPERELWDSLSRNSKRNIKEYEKQSLVLKPSTDVDLFFEIMKNDLEGKDPTFFNSQSPEYLREIMTTYPDYVKMFALHNADQILAMAVNIEYKGRLLNWMAGKADAKDNCGEYLMWELLREARARGLKGSENWGTEQRRLCQFKSKFNPGLEVTCSVRKADRIARMAIWTYGSVKQIPVLSSIIKV